MQIDTRNTNLRRARAVNQTSNGYVAKNDTLTEPFGDAGTATGASVIELGGRVQGGLTPNLVIIVPYGVGSNNNTFSVRVIGWYMILLEGLSQWVPINLCELACTLTSSATGVSGGILDTTQLYADTITVTVGSTLTGESPSENIVSPANDTRAHAVIDLKGARKLELTFTTGGSATSCNALVGLI